MRIGVENLSDSKVVEGGTMMTTTWDVELRDEEGDREEIASELHQVALGHYDFGCSISVESYSLPCPYLRKRSRS